MKTTFQKHPNLLKIIALGLILFIINFFISSKITNQKIISNDQTRLETINLYKTNIESKNKTPYEFLIQGIKQLNTGETELALITLEKTVSDDENYRDGWLYLGIAYLKTDDADSAIKALENAKKIDPIYPETYKYLSLAYKNQGNAEKTEECYNKFIGFSKK
ncbi:MAG: tetratricopeptide repeat protein [Patescibacteria group bacterium]|jgi:Tfp pilus assembly protein PilF